MYWTNFLPSELLTPVRFDWQLIPSDLFTFDTEPKIRLAVLSTLHERFDKHLAQAENVRSLFIALNDEHFENRMVAVGLIGRLALHNPAYVMPSLRKALIQLLTELEYSTVMQVSVSCSPEIRRADLYLLVGGTEKNVHSCSRGLSVPHNG